MNAPKPRVLDPDSATVPADAPIEKHHPPSYLVELGIARNERRVWAWVREGKLRALRLGSIRISESALREFLARHTTGGAR